MTSKSTVITHIQYVEANLCLEELIKVVDDSTPSENPLTKEFIEVSNLIEQYEEVYYPIRLPNLIEVIELRMLEMNLKRKDLAIILGTTESIIKNYLNG